MSYTKSQSPRRVRRSFRSLSIWTKLSIPAGLSCLTLLFVVLSVRSGLNEQRSVALGVNVAGRQRMLNQRVHKEVLASLAGAPQDVGASLALLDTSAFALRDGGEVPLGKDKRETLGPAGSPTERALLDEQVELIQVLEQTVGELEASEAAPETLADFETLTKQLHKTANHLVLAMQRRSEAELDALMSRALILALGAISVCMALTFRTLRAMGLSFAEVRSAARRLAAGDLDFDLESSSDDTIGRMANDLGGAIAGIREGLGQRQVTWDRVASDREAESIMRNATLKQAPGGIIQADWSGNILFANPAASSLLSRAGLVRGTSIAQGTPLASLFLDSGVPAKAFNSTEQGASYSLMHDEVCLDVRVLPIFDDASEPLGRLVTVEDTTERAQREFDSKDAADRAEAKQRELSASVQEILMVVAQAVSGDLSARTGWTGDAPVSQVGRELDTLLSFFETNMQQLAEEVLVLKDAAESMDDNSSLLDRSAEETAAKAKEAFHASESTARNAGATAAGLSQVTHSIQAIASSASRAADISKEAVEAAAKSSDLMQSLGSRSQEIDDVVKVIKSIAGQTNLLALNATIEAARAGESGKGFAVVANEVKGLATETALATRQINDRIDGIKTDIERAIESIDGIQGVIVSIEETQSTIASSVEEQSATAQEMSRQVEDAAASTETVRSALEFVASRASITANGSQKSMEAARHMGAMSEKLEGIVARYRIGQ